MTEPDHSADCDAVDRRACHYADCICWCHASDETAASRYRLKAAVAAGVQAARTERISSADWDAAMETTVETAAQAAVEYLLGLLGSDHYVVITGDRWTVEHSAECRLSGNMAGCDYHVTIRDWMADVTDTRGRPLVHPRGRWRIVSIDGDGWPELEWA